MNVKRYQAETWEEVLALVKADLGEKFVVLHTKTFVKGGVLGFGGKEMYEVTATRDAASADQSASAPAREPERLRVDGRQHLARISESIQRLPEASSDERPVRSRTDRIQRTLRRSAAAADLGEQAADARAEDAPAGAAGFGAGRVASRPGRADERAPGRPADRRSGRDAPVGAPPSNAPPAPAGVEREEPAAPSAASRNLTGSRFDAVVAEVASPIAGPPAPNPADVSLSRPTAAAAVGGEMVTYGPGGRLVKPAPPAPEPAGIAQLQEQVRALHVRVAEMSRSGDRTRAAHGAPAVSDGARPALDLALATLLERELPESLARDVAARAAAALTPDQGGSREALRAALVGLLAEVVASAPEPAVARGVRRVVALVGGTGVGKTTTIAKLAAKARVGGEAAVGIVTVDTYRIAAVDQLRTIADIISVPLRAVTSPKDLGEALAEFAEMDLVFLDTAGRTHRDRLRMSELRAFLAVARADETHLVLPAVTSLSNMLDMARAYGVTGVNRLLFTKLDEAVCLGPLFGAAAALKTVLSYVTAGQDIPEDIEPADPRRLADLFLADAP